MKFAFYASNTSLKNISVAVYELENGNYNLVVEKDGEQVKGTYAHEISVEDYEDLPHDPCNSLVRFYAAAELCGFEF
ncbi:hypothetical protein [Moraxella bovis]|uniref:Uncharacterized protein n=1 Tax=Moraxella bovis TaxID=476 RepID=A0A378Q074_MORBO|nr:hypothetical protein [Moraxella bovis]STY93794.1 Uncharacterised protein [Moraxella bovis]